MQYNPNIYKPHGKMPFENILRMEENAGNQHLLPFPNAFYPGQKYQFRLP